MPPSIHQLNTALWSTFLAATDVRGVPRERMPMPAEETLSLLLSLLNSGKLREIPRPLLGLAIWNLLPQFLGKPDATKLQPLLHHAIGMSLEQVQLIYSQTKDPLLILARQYNILDYRWEFLPAGDNPKELGAKLHVCVQGEMDSLKHVVFPDHWPTHGWLWETVDLIDRRAEPRWRKEAAGEETLRAQVKLPGGPREGYAKVDLDVTFRSTPLDVTNDFSIRGEMFKSCNGSFTVEKMRGRPGATRITHTKKVEFVPSIPETLRRDLLRCWLQTETLRLVLPA